MTSVGRNDPCPCGSGKKYKYCHWRIDQQIRRQNLQVERTWRSLGQRIRQFGTQRRLMADLVSAWELFWDNRIPVEAASAADEMQHNRFMDWYAFDYRTANRKRIAELFLDEQQSELSSLEQDLIRDWVKTYVTVYQVGAVTGDEIDLRDVFSDEGKSAHESGADRVLRPGMLIMGRLLPVGGTLRFAPGITLMRAGMKGELLEFVQPRFEAWQRARYGAGWKDFLSEAGYLLNHFLIRDMEPIAPSTIEELEMDPMEAAHSIARRMQSEIITSTLDLHYERWLDKPVPEWAGKTPREMVRTPEGIEMVEVLLDVLEDIESRRARSGQPAADVVLLRRKLGLTREARTAGGIILPR